MSNLVTKIQRQRLFQTGETVVVAVSGGADSVALLDILTRLAEEKLSLVVAHLNHGLRGADSDGDQEFVSRLAAGYGLPCEIRRADVAGLAQSCRLSLEDAGRGARYRFFAEVAQNHRAASIALAHHRDDQAETVLIRLLRGAGGAGLSAMANSARQLKRPLLQSSRAEIERYLKGRGLSHRTDASNADTAILRNSIRHELIPFLRKYNPKISERLAATAEILACDEELLEGLTETAYARVARPDPSGTALAIEELAREPRGLRLRLYRRALSALRGDLRHIGLAHLEAVDRLIGSSRPNGRVQLPGACVAARSYGSLHFSVGAGEPAQPDWELAVAGEGSYPLPCGGRLLVASVPRPACLATGSPRIAYLDPEAAPFPWLLRGFAPGDRFTPLGMTGMQKVKELFINEKIPAPRRPRIPLLVCRGRVLWVCGVRMAQQARVTAATGAVLRAEILDIAP